MGRGGTAFGGALGAWIVLAPAAAAALDPSKPLALFTQVVFQAANGLPQNSCEAIVQTRDGYLWFGTQEGLVRFDGVRFKVFDTLNTPALNYNHVTALHEAQDGSLWIATVGGGVVRHRDRRFESLTEEAALPTDRVDQIAEDAAGGLWIATPVGVSRYDAGRWSRLGREQGLPSGAVKAVAVGRDGTVWAGTSAGLARLRDGAFETVHEGELPPRPMVTALLADPDGAVWVGTRGGLALLEPGGSSLRRPARDPPELRGFVRALHRDRAGALWIGTHGGLYRLVGGRLDPFTRQEGLSGVGVAALLEDREGNLWVGTDGGGVNVLKEGPVTTYTTRQGLSSDSIYSIAGARHGGLWTGTYAGHVDRLEDGRFVPVGLLPGGDRVRALHEDAAGVLWIGTDRGLFRRLGGVIRPLGAAEGVPGFPVRVIHSDGEGRVWVGTDGGGVVVLGGEEPRSLTEEQGLAGNSVRAILEDRRGDVWIGAYGGLSRIRDGRIETFGPAQGLPEMVRCLYEDGEGALWIGTYGAGLARLEGSHVASFTVRHGLLSDVIYQVLEDDEGRLWMSCNKGIFSVAKRDLAEVAAGRLRAVQVRTYGEADGMRSRECNGGSPAGQRTRDGRLWFPTLAGVSVVDPRAASVLPEVPRALLEEMTTPQRSVPASGDVRLSARERRFELRYTAPTFGAPERLRFRFRLDGFDRGWIEAGARRVAYYTNVPPGRYRFRVAVTHEGAPWSADDTVLGLELEPLLHETGAFRGGLGVLALAGLAAAYLFRVRRLRRNERLLQRRVDEALARVKVLSGLLPICASCKKIRDDGGYWNQVEVYIRERTEADFTHSICPDCLRRLYPELGPRPAGRDEPAAD